MTFPLQTLVQVYYHTQKSKILVGRLLLKNRTIYFEYDNSFLKNGISLSPFKLPLKPGVVSCQDQTFEGLFGLFNDSLPDGWGRLLLDRKLLTLGINPNHLSPIDRLCFVGHQGMGALSYEPEHSESVISLKTDLDKLNSEIEATLNENNQYLDDLIGLNGSSSGARPKVLININKEDWLIKFKSSLDPKDIGPIEYAYHLMAVDAGLLVPEAKLFASKQGPGYFGVKRFDRISEQKIHMHTIAGLIHADHRLPSLDYETIMKVTQYLTQDIKECEAQFRNAVFNILSHNRDDHAKNFSFTMTDSGEWKVSPAYDLTYSAGPSNEHSTLIMGEGKMPTQNHLLRLAAVGNIKKEIALQIIEEVSAAISRWPEFAELAHVSKTQTKLIARAITK